MAKSATKPPPPQATVTAKPPQQAGKPAVKGGVKGSAPPVAKGSVKGSAPPVAKGSFKGSAPPVVTQKPPTHARKHQKMSRDSPKVWADDDDIDLEDLTFALPIVISLILLFVFFFRQYVRRTVQCPSSNRLEGKTVVITGNTFCVSCKSHVIG